MSTRGNIRERGMASLMVTTILMLVISLIVVGFSQVARRNQREVLDRQLSSQAFYATESGINAATAVIRNHAANNQPIPAKTECEPDANYPAVELSGEDVKVTCLLVEPEVSALEYDGVTENTPTVIPVTPVAGNSGSITITWRPSSGPANATAGCTSAATPSYSLPQRASWACGHGILRLDMSAQPSGSVAQQATTVFLYPHAVSGAIDSFSTLVNVTTFGGGIVMARCTDHNNDPKCMASIIGINTPVYYLGARSLYRDSRVSVDGTDAVTGSSLSFTGQVKVDVTARAIDVLRRVQVRIPLEEQRDGSAPAYGIETSESLCKRFSVAPSYYYADPVAGCPLP